MRFQLYDCNYMLILIMVNYILILIMVEAFLYYIFYEDLNSKYIQLSKVSHIHTPDKWLLEPCENLMYDQQMH